MSIGIKVALMACFIPPVVMTGRELWRLIRHREFSSGEKSYPLTSANAGPFLLWAFNHAVFMLMIGWAASYILHK